MGGGHHAGRREEDTVRRPRWGEGHGEEATMQGGHDVEDTMGRHHSQAANTTGGPVKLSHSVWNYVELSLSL